MKRIGLIIPLHEKNNLQTPNYTKNKEKSNGNIYTKRTKKKKQIKINKT